MNLLFSYQLIILYLFNFNLKSVNCVVVPDGLHLTSTATIAPPSLLVLPIPTTLGLLTDIHKQYPMSSIGGGSISSVGVSDRYGHGGSSQYQPMHLQEYKPSGNDKTFIEETLNKYKARHNDKLAGDNQNSEHKSSKEEGQHFHESEKGAKGESTKDKHHKQYEDKGGKQHEDYDEDSNLHHHYNQHGGGSKSKFHKKNRDNKRRSEKGFHSKYHKNEHRKLDDFFKNYNENGDFVKYGVRNTKVNKVYKNLKKGAHKSQKGSESKVQKKGPQIVKLTII